MATNNLVCVCVGDAYSTEYVENLYAGARQYTTVDFDFWVFTDNVDQFSKKPNWHFVELEKYDFFVRGWWYKLEIFNQAVLPIGNNLYIDLDCVVVNDLADFWNFNHNTLGICHDFNRQFSRNINLSNSSVMTWQNSSMHWLYNYYKQNQQSIVKKFRGDQDLIHAEVENKCWFPKDWAMSWRWEIQDGGLESPGGNYKAPGQCDIPGDTKLVVCHGKPKPHDIDKLTIYWNKYVYTEGYKKCHKEKLN